MSHRIFVDEKGNYAVTNDGGDIRLSVVGMDAIEVTQETAGIARKQLEKRMLFDRDNQKFVKRLSKKD